MQPDAKTIGILYTTSEPNSVSAVEEYQAKAPEFGFTIEAIGVMQQSEVLQAADTMISKGVDCMTNLTDNNVVGVLPSILEKTNDAGIPVYGSEIEQVKIGCVASAGIEYVALGKRTGEMAAKILKGEATAEEMPYETITDSEIYINPGVLETLGLTVPEDIAAEAIDVTCRIRKGKRRGFSVMNAMMELCISTLTQGFIYALLSYGVYITYKILDFPDPDC